MINPIELNVLGAQQLVSSRLNKSNQDASTQEEGVEGEQLDELSLDLDDQELLRLSKKWIAKYAKYEKGIKDRQDKNLSWYLGKSTENGAVSATDPISANILFEAEETFLPAALAKNPEPQVWCDNTPEGDKLATTVKTMLQFHADTLVLRKKLSMGVRHWSIYFLGVWKHGWDDEIQEITTEVIQPQDLILDPDGFVDAYGDYEGYLGQRITVTASKLAELFPKEKEYISLMVDGKMGTDVVYTEWWTDEYCFYTFKERVLDKHKNEFFNWPKKVTVQQLSPEGEVIDVDQEQQGHNHFARAKKPYTFLSVFSLQKQPHDITSLIEQNIPNQRRITRRTEQIDYNLSRQNNSTVFSKLAGVTQEEGKQAANAMAKGHPVLLSGDLNQAIKKIDMSPVPASFFDELEASKGDLRSIFGVQGITAQEPDKDQTARGMILRTQYDNSRIGGGIGDAIEQVADNIFNWWVQLYYIYYDERHVAAIMGTLKAVEYVTLQSSDFTRKLVVSVAPDSMAPKDELSEMNQSIQLYEMGVLDPKTLLTRLNYPDADNTSEQAVLWLLDKNAYIQLNYPQLAQKLQMLQQQQMQAQAQQQQMAMQQQHAEGQQKLAHTQQAHQQKLSHKEQVFNQQMALKRQKAASFSGTQLSAGEPNGSLNAVKLPR